MAAHCGTCKHRLFEGIEHKCRVNLKDGQPRTISRAKWDEKRADGSNVCSCGKYWDWEEKTIPRSTER